MLSVAPNDGEREGTRNISTTSRPATWNSWVLFAIRLIIARDSHLSIKLTARFAAYSTAVTCDAIIDSIVVPSFSIAPPHTALKAEYFTLLFWANIICVD